MCKYADVLVFYPLFIARNEAISMLYRAALQSGIASFLAMTRGERHKRNKSKVLPYHPHFSILHFNFPKMRAVAAFFEYTA
jgi:hypothetical protein